MSLLFDTNVILFGLLDSRKLPPFVRARINDNSEQIFASVASVYEIGFKIKLGKLALPSDFDVIGHLRRTNIQIVEISGEHARIASQLPMDNRDPWDRIIVAQCLVEGHQLVSSDDNITKLGIGRIW